MGREQDGSDVTLQKERLLASTVVPVLPGRLPPGTFNRPMKRRGLVALPKGPVAGTGAGTAAAMAAKRMAQVDFIVAFCVGNLCWKFDGVFVRCSMDDGVGMLGGGDDDDQSLEGSHAVLYITLARRWCTVSCRVVLMAMHSLADRKACCRTGRLLILATINPRSMGTVRLRMPWQASLDLRDAALVLLVCESARGELGQVERVFR